MSDLSSYPPPPTPSSGGSAPPPPPSTAQSAFGGPPPPPPGGGEVGADKATTALVLAILGLLCCGPLAVVAVVMGSGARSEAQRTGRPLNSTMNAAWIVGIIGTVLWVLGILLAIVSSAA